MDGIGYFLAGLAMSVCVFAVFANISNRFGSREKKKNQRINATCRNMGVPREKKCGSDEVWDECPHCLNTCSSRLPEDKCGKECKPAQCVCKKGYVRDTGSTVEQPCIPEEHSLTHDPVQERRFKPFDPRQT
uniref:TIL domain-containing protein n=1 Tax=Steinernema glaseri TaxID=37863 RepID=A0A1I7YU58_9BILA